MKLSMRWLSDYYKVERDIKDYIDAMTMSGSKVEGYEKENDHLSKVVLGQVLEVVKHPDADTLYICTVTVGKETVQIVTGADNVLPDAFVAVALHKSRLPNGQTITRGKLRGEVSEGMLCSLEELNLTQGDFPYAVEEGIFLLQEEGETGDPIDEVLGLDDTIVEFEITSNRPDCLSVLGLARETAATFGDKFTPPQPQVQGGGRPIKELLSLQVDNTTLCQRYMAAGVENVKIGPSPRWIRERLRASGVRPINNIVDITNFVMLEYGHPMHAFDLRHVADNKIIVRNAKEGEVMTTLDGIERKLNPSMLVIADGKEATAVAGVMGGEHSGIYEDTKTVIFEAACFVGSSVRLTAQTLGLRTESSGRFEKGLDPETCEQALKRACELVEQLGIGTVAEGFVDSYHAPYTPKELPFNPSWINQFVGIDVDTSTMEQILDRLDFQVRGDKVLVPSFRAKDMHVENDIAEEVARIYGYDHIPTTILRGESKGLVSEEQRFRNNIGHTLVAEGFSEIQTYSFFSPKNYDKMGLVPKDTRRTSVTIQNPLGEDTSVLRTTPIPSMLLTLASNYNHRNPEAWLFEIATKYLPSDREEEQPQEPLTIMLGQYGPGRSLFTLKGGVEALLEKFGLTDKSEFQAVTTDPTFHPGRCAHLVIEGQVAGILGEIHPKIAENFELDTPVFVAELDYQAFFNLREKEFNYQPLPKFPASTRDLALVAGVSLPVGEMEKAIKNGLGALLEKVELFDIYQGDQIEKGKKSVAFALTLRGKDKTLTDGEADKGIEKALEKLKELGAFLRE